MLPICIPVDGPMRQEHLLGLDGACQRCHVGLGPVPLPAPPQPLLVDRVAPPPRPPEVLRHEIQVSTTILEPPAPTPVVVEEPVEGSRALTPEEVERFRTEWKQEVRELMGMGKKEPEDDVFKAGLVLWVGPLVGFRPAWVADFMQLNRGFCRAAVRRLCAAGIWERPGPYSRARWSEIAWARWEEDAKKATGKRGRGGHKGDAAPFRVRFCLFSLVGAGQAEYGVEDRFRLSQKGLDVVEAGA